VRIQEKAQCLTDQKRCLADNASRLAEKETLSTEIEVLHIAQNIKANVNNDAVNAAINQKQAVLNAILLAQGLDNNKAEEALASSFKSNARLRNALFVFFGIFGGIAGVIYAFSFMTGIMNPGVDTIASAPFMAEAWFKASYLGVFGVYAIAIEVFCCAIGLPLLIDAALSNFLPRNYDEYLQQALAKEGLKFETVAEFDADAKALVERQVLKQQFKEPWFKWLTRVATAPFMLVGIMSTNAFGTFLFVTNSFNKMFGGTVVTLPLAMPFGAIMFVASLVFNLRRAISMLPQAPYGEVKITDSGIAWANDDIQKAAEAYENMSVFTWMGNGLASIGAGFSWLMNNKWKATKITAGAILALVLGGSLAFVTIAGLGSVISDVFSLNMAYGAGLALFGYISGCIAVTQYLALKGSLDNGIVAPDAIDLFDNKKGTYTLGADITLCNVTKHDAKEKIFFDRAADFFSKAGEFRIGNLWSISEFFAKTGQWFTLNKGFAQALSLLAPLLTASVSSSLLGFGIGGPFGAAIAVGLTLTLMITFGVANFVLYNFDTRGERTFEKALASFVWGMTHPVKMGQDFGAWCMGLYHRMKGYTPVSDNGSDNGSVASADTGLPENLGGPSNTSTAAFNANQVNGAESGAGVNPSKPEPAAPSGSSAPSCNV